MISSAADQADISTYGLKKLKDIEDRFFAPKPNMLHMGSSLDEALEILSHAFGVSSTLPQRVVKIFGLQLLIDFNLLVHIVEKRQNGRERFALFAQKALMQPFEVWKTLYADGSYRYVYLGIFSESKYHIAVIIHILNNGQVLWNYMNCELRSLEKLRKGTLEYSALNT